MLLNRFHVALQKIVIERSIGLRVTFEFMQSNLRLIGHLRHRYGLRKLFLNPFLALLGNLVVALVGLGDALQFVSNRILDLAHLVADINHRKVTFAIASRQVCFAPCQLEILRTQLIDHLVFQAIGDRRIGRCIFVKSVLRTVSIRSSRARASADWARAIINWLVSSDTC